jgi:ubiquinone/menaquinone biosynthesis C-methylase UbiE
VDQDYVAVTEIAGDEVTQEQIDRLCNRYYWAGEYCRDKDVVEAACGSGQGLGYLAGIARSIEAGDYSDEILSIARRHYGERIRLRQFDAQNMPFEDKSKDVIIIFEAIYYLPDATKFVQECARVLRPGGKVLIATANRDLFDFNPSPYTYKYYGTIELRELFERSGFNVKLYGYMDVRSVSMRQRILRPIKFLASKARIIPGSTQGKKWLKRVVFGGLVEMPVEIGPQITQITRINGRKKAQKAQKGPHPSGIRSDKLNATCCDSVNLTRQAVTSEFHGAGITPQRNSPDQSGILQGKQIEKDEGTLYRTRYVEPERISSSRADTEHKVIYCVASLG